LTPFCAQIVLCRTIAVSLVVGTTEEMLVDSPFSLHPSFVIHKKSQFREFFFKQCAYINA
jgi:hypothetical protein